MNKIKSFIGVIFTVSSLSLLCLSTNNAMAIPITQTKSFSTGPVSTIPGITSIDTLSIDLFNETPQKKLNSVKVKIQGSVLVTGPTAPNFAGFAGAPLPYLININSGLDFDSFGSKLFDFGSSARLVATYPVAGT